MSRPLCAACDRTNATSYICADCKKDPVNADWVGDEDHHQVEDIEAVATAQAHKGVRLGTLAHKRQSKTGTTDLERRIVVEVLRQYIGIDPDMRLISASVIADKLDCTPQYVRRVMHAMRS